MLADHHTYGCGPLVVNRPQVEKRWDRRLVRVQDILFRRFHLILCIQFIQAIPIANLQVHYT